MYDKYDDEIAYGTSVAETAYPSYRPAAELRLHGGSTLTMEDYTQLAGHVVADQNATSSSYAKVSLSSKTKISVTSYEANGYCNSSPDYTIPYYFDLALVSTDGEASSVTLAAGRTYYGTSDGWTTKNPTPVKYDLNGDNVVNSDDLNLLLANYLGTGTGDINSDGVVNSDDLNLLLEHYLEAQS
jgi:hypothetical protein